MCICVFVCVSVCPSRVFIFPNCAPQSVSLYLHAGRRLFRDLTNTTDRDPLFYTTATVTASRLREWCATRGLLNDQQLESVLSALDPTKCGSFGYLAWAGLLNSALTSPIATTNGHGVGANAAVISLVNSSSVVTKPAAPPSALSPSDQAEFVSMLERMDRITQACAASAYILW